MDNVIPLSATASITEFDTTGGGGGGGGGVVVVGVAGEVAFIRDLKENFCFGTLFAFSAFRILDISFNCYNQLTPTKFIPPDIVVDHNLAATTRVEYTPH